MHQCIVTSTCIYNYNVRNACNAIIKLIELVGSGSNLLWNVMICICVFSTFPKYVGSTKNYGNEIH